MDEKRYLCVLIIIKKNLLATLHGKWDLSAMIRG